MISVNKDLNSEFTMSYISEKVTDTDDLYVYQFVKFHLEHWEVGQYLGGN